MLSLSGWDGSGRSAESPARGERLASCRSSRRSASGQPVEVARASSGLHDRGPPINDGCRWARTPRSPGRRLRPIATEIGCVSQRGAFQATESAAIRSVVQVGEQFVDLTVQEPQSRDRDLRLGGLIRPSARPPDPILVVVASRPIDPTDERSPGSTCFRERM